MLILLNITTVENAAFQVIMALKREHGKQYEGSVAYIHTVISNIQMQMICDRPVLYGKWNSVANFMHVSHMTINNPFLSY